MGFIEEAIVLCAGLGTRMRPVSDVVPKPMIPIFSVPLFQFQVDMLVHMGVKKIVVNLHHKADYFLKKLELIEFQGADLVISDETDQLLDSGGGVVTAAQYIENDWFYWVNGDNCMVYPKIDLNDMRGIHLILCEARPDDLYTRILVDEKEKIVLSLSSEVSASRYFFSGAGIMSKSAVKDLKRKVPFKFVDQILKPQIFKKAVTYSISTDPWMDVGSLKNWYESHVTLSEPKVYQKFPWITQKRIVNNIAIGWDHQKKVYVDPKVRRSLSDDELKRVQSRSLIYDRPHAEILSSELNNMVGIEGVWAQL